MEEMYVASRMHMCAEKRTFLGKHNLPSIMHYAPCIMHHAPGIVHHASCILHHASCIMHHVFCIMHKKKFHPPPSKKNCEMHQTGAKQSNFQQINNKWSVRVLRESQNCYLKVLNSSQNIYIKTSYRKEWKLMKLIYPSVQCL